MAARSSSDQRGLVTRAHAGQWFILGESVPRAGESVPSVVSVWPTCDWHERETFDLMGIEFEGHPNLERLLMVAIDRSGPFTRAELTRATGLSGPTVGSLASQLIRGGLIRNLGVGPASAVRHERRVARPRAR